jgi:UDP-glucuronate decarboxylase
MKTHILVTGGAGNIGSALVRRLAENPDYSIVVADDFSTGSPEKVPRKPNVQCIKCDVNHYNDISAMFFRHPFEYVFHFAAVVGVQRTLAAPLTVLRDITGIENILMLSKNTGVRRIFFSSSSEVYGEPFEIPQNEDTTPLNSRLPYAIVKNLAEAYLKSYEQEYGLPYTIFRFFNTYGPNQSDDFVVPRFIRRALRGEDISVYGDGSQTRTFCYVDDTIDTCLATLSHGEFINDTINIGSDQELTILELAHAVMKRTDSQSKIVHLPPLADGDMTRRRPDNSKMRSLLNRELIPLDVGIGRLIDHYHDSD